MELEFEEPVIWFEGPLMSDAASVSPTAMQLDVQVEGATKPKKVIVSISGPEQLAAAKLAGRKGVGVMVKGRMADEGTGVDVIADSIAFDPRHAADDGKGEE
ncbi:MAG: aminopeptidase [Bifidobacterium longum]